MHISIDLTHLLEHPAPTCIYMQYVDSEGYNKGIYFIIWLCFDIFLPKWEYRIAYERRNTGKRNIWKAGRCQI